MTASQRNIYLREFPPSHLKLHQRLPLWSAAMYIAGLWLMMMLLFFFLSYHRYLSEQRTTFINILLGTGKRAKVSEVRGYSQHHLLLAYCCWRGRERENIRKQTRCVCHMVGAEFLWCGSSSLLQLIKWFPNWISIEPEAPLQIPPAPWWTVSDA